MSRFLFTRRIFYPSSPYPLKVFKYYSSILDSMKLFEREKEPCTPTVCDNSTSTPASQSCGIKLPTLFPTCSSNRFEGFSIDLVDPYVWPQTLSAMGKSMGNAECLKENKMFDEMPECNSQVEGFSDFDEIEDLRLRKKLFYKLDRDSKEFEEYNINFHLKKSLKKEREKPTKAEMKKECKKAEKQTKVEVKKERKKSDKANEAVKPKGKPLSRLDSAKPNSGCGKELIMEGKRVRTPTFNQLTGPYHLPFCLDIFVTKGSVRASIIHRVTSRVVAVAHSISKDLKFDLNSRKDAKACATVGGVLAQRAIEDDIHNVVYTPRKGDKLEGKLQIVLQSIMDGGIDVKVKLKQKRHIKVSHDCQTNSQKNTTLCSNVGNLRYPKDSTCYPKGFRDGTVHIF